MSNIQNKIDNIIKFTINFASWADCNVMDQSPDYILEKHRHWLGNSNMLVPMSPGITKSHKRLTQSYIKTYADYYDKWQALMGRQSFLEKNEKIENIVDYLMDVNLLQKGGFLEMANKFEENIGPLEFVSDEKKVGLHFLTIKKVFDPYIIENENDIKIISRQLNLISLEV